MEKLKNAIAEAIEAKEKGENNANIKNHLERKGFSENEAKQILKAADHHYLNRLMERPKNRLHFTFSNTIMGYILIALGSIVTLFSYLQIINFHGVYIFFYGPIVAGIAMIAADKKGKFNEREKEFTFKRRFKRNE